MTEGYAPGPSYLPEPPARPLTRADRAEVLFSIEHAMKYRHGKPTNAARDVAVRVLAEMVLEHLETSNYVIMRGPPAPAHSTPGTKPRIPMKD
jgi:hypothetical protein